MNNGAKKVFLIIGIALLSVVLCYFSVVLYFYYGRPNDITGKLSVWNLMSDQEIGEMYLDASYDIRYGEENFYGVNVDASGYVVTCYKNFDEYSGEDILLYNKNGSIYSGEIVFSNDVFNLAVLKLSDYVNSSATLNLPYVKTGALGSSIFGGNYLSIGNPFDEDNVNDASNVTSSIGYTSKLYDELDVVDYICLDSIRYTVSDYEQTSQGAIFNRSGRLVGLAYAYAVNEDDLADADVYAVPTSVISHVIDKLKKSENVDISIVGFDMQELAIYLLYEINENQIYFNGSLMTLDDKLIDYCYSADGVFLAEDFSLNGVTLSKNNLITSISYDGYSQSITTRYDLYSTLYSLDAGTSFTLTSIDLTTDSVIKTNFII